MTAHRFPSTLALTLTLLVLAAHAAASGTATPNDTAEDAIPIPTDTFALAQPTTTATHAGELRPCSNIGATVWYSYQPRSAHWTRAQTHGSNYDTVLAVYVDTPLGLVLVGCNDDAGGGTSPATSRVTWYADDDATYYIQAGGYNARTGALVLRLENAAPESAPVPPLPPVPPETPPR